MLSWYYLDELISIWAWALKSGLCQLEVIYLTSNVWLWSHWASQASGMSVSVLPLHDWTGKCWLSKISPRCLGDDGNVWDFPPSSDIIWFPDSLKYLSSFRITPCPIPPIPADKTCFPLHRVYRGVLWKKEQAHFAPQLIHRKDMPI